MFSRGDRLVLAVSGGIDSVVLCELMKTAGYEFSIAHCNFNLRGEESTRDELFVRQLAENYDASFFLNSFDTTAYARINKMSIQEAARELRYEWFEELAGNTEEIKGQHNPASFSKISSKRKSFVLTAHHLDDDVETMVFHFFQGTGISGLRGMPLKRNFIVRPLLDFSRIEIEKFAKEKNLQWVEDSSNISMKYTRNFIRHELIPIAEKSIPNAGNNLRSNLARFKEAEILYNQAIDQHRKKLLVQKNDEWLIPVEKLRLSHPPRTILYELIAPFGFTSAQLPDAMQLMNSETGKFINSPTHRLLRNRNWLIISKIIDGLFHDQIIQQDTEKVIFPGGEINFSATENVEINTDSPRSVTIDQKALRYPLILRKWRTGDYFYPLGMKKKKKLSRFFIDLKLSKNEKEHVLVLESDKRIIWVVGYRIDDRFKVVDNTSSVLNMRYHSI